MTYLKPELKEQLFDFCRQMLATRDYDPNYFAVKGFCESNGLGEEERYEFCFIFNGFYHFGSADRYWKDRSLNPAKLAYGKSRRGFNGTEKIRDFISCGRKLQPDVFAERYGGEAGWARMYEKLLSVPGCGHWSAYYLCDMMKVVLGFKIAAPNLGFLSSSSENRGPMSGLRFITGIPEAVLRKDTSIHRAVYREMLEGVPFEGMEQFESLLCNFLSLHKKTYYVGRDIDRQMAMMEGLGDDWWGARTKYFPRQLLGEFNGWSRMGTFEPGRTYA
jgi:hypothetical protein